MYALYNSTITTTHCNILTFKLLTTYAATITPKTPKVEVKNVILREYESNLINCILPIGTENVQAPIIIGNATAGFNPKAYTVAIVKAYEPMPTLLNAPKSRDKNPNITSFQPVSPTSAPPDGYTPNLPININIAAIISPTEINFFIDVTFILTTNLGPIYAPIT